LKNNLGERIVAVSTVDKMTVPQIAAKVREYFLNSKSDDIPHSAAKREPRKPEERVIPLPRVVHHTDLY
jgi:hypothetical protein